MKRIATTLSLIWLLTAASTPAQEVQQPAAGTLAVATSWPGRPYVEVRGYAYNSESGQAATDDQSQDIIRKGKLAATVTNKAGALLAPAQVERLIQSITGEHAKHLGLKCFIPHHAFVFYNAAGKPVAWVEICFKCGNLEISPPAPGHSYQDFDALYYLCEELKLPLNQ